MSRLELHNVGKSFNGTAAVRDVSFTVDDRELFVLVGPSGCGKTTLLRLIAGLEEADAGRILLDRRAVNDESPKSRNVAMVFQNYALYPHMTVYENMAFGLRMRGYSAAEIDARVRQSAEMLEIGGLLERRPPEISGGQRQRVAVGRAIVRRPRVFLFDEPFSNLDAKLRAQARADLLQLHRRLQTTMIYVTHDQVEAMTLGDRICVMKDGEIQQIGPPAELYQRPRNRFVAEFIGAPAMNLFEVTLLERGGKLWLDQGHFQLRLPARYKRGAPLKPGRPLLAGFRPEDLHDRLFESGAAVDGNAVIAVVRLVEPVGPETHVHMESGGARFIARLPASSSVQLNQPMEILFNMERVHLFSRDGQERIGPDL